MTNLIKKILIVDDETSLVQLCKFILEEAGFTVRGAFNGTQALALIQEEMPDLVLLDVMMPGMTGIDVCKVIREQYLGKRPFIMMYTADDRNQTRQKSIAAGANDFLTKEVAPFELVDKIACCIPTA